MSSLKIRLTDGRHGTLSTDHAASSYGLPVALIDGVPHGPADLGDVAIDVPEHVIEAVALLETAKVAGFRLVVEQSYGVPEGIAALLRRREGRA